MEFRTIELSDPQFETDGLRYLTVKSSALKARADVSVFLPEQIEGKADVPVVVLLHGVYGSHWAWTLKGGAHRTLAKMISDGDIAPFILVMPSDGLWGDGSGYVPHQVQNFEVWIGEELPSLILQTVEAVGTQSKFYIGGLSMGGYGAFRIGGKYPSVYHGISGHSSIIDIQQMKNFVEEDWSFWSGEGEANSIAELILNNWPDFPPFRFDCGTEDDLLTANQTLHKILVKANIPHEYEEFAGKHDWAYWQKQVKRTFKFFHSLC